MKVRDFVMVTSSDEITIIDGEQKTAFCLDHTDVSEILHAFGERQVYIITATGKDQIEIIVKQKDSNV